MADAALTVLAAGWLCICVWIAWLAWSHDQALFAAAFMLLVGAAPLYVAVT